MRQKQSIFVFAGLILRFICEMHICKIILLLVNLKSYYKLKWQSHGIKSLYATEYFISFYITTQIDCTVQKYSKIIKIILSEMWDTSAKPTSDLKYSSKHLKTKNNKFDL